MKRIFAMVLSFFLLTGCGAQRASVVDWMPSADPQGASVVDLMPGADPQTSALALYIYDGESIVRRHLFETAEYRAHIMEDFHHAEVREAALDVTKLQPPFYGIEMGGGDLGMICGLWSDGYFIAQNGKAYAFDYDFEALLQEHPWDEPEAFSNLAVMPCASRVAKAENSWNRAFLTRAKELVPPSGISLFAQLVGDEVHIRFENDSQEEWNYGYDYGLEVLLDGIWYMVPAEQEMAFIEVLCVLPPGGRTEQTYSLAPYGHLPGGTYRFVTQGLSAEFTME